MAKKNDENDDLDAGEKPSEKKRKQPMGKTEDGRLVEVLSASLFADEVHAAIVLGRMAGLSLAQYVSKVMRPHLMKVLREKKMPTLEGLWEERTKED